MRLKVLSLVVLAWLSADALWAADPVVTGPVATTAAPGDPSHDYPFFAALEDLKARGYVEQEFFVSGTANRYETPDRSTGKVIDGNHKYLTRLVVRRPAIAARFNGTVIVEWNNVTSGHDLDIDWYQIHEHLIRSGYAWVGVTAQRIGVEALKVWNRNRYGSLDVSDGGAIANDALSYDVFADVGRAARAPKGADFLGGLKPQRVFATGHSQSSARLATYVNSVHPLDPVFDAVILHGGGGRIRTDLKIRIWKLNSETDVIIGQAAARQPDTDMFRTWEVAGDSHVDTQFIASRGKLVARDGNPIASGFTPGLRGGGTAPAPAPQLAGGASPCDQPPYSDVPFYQVMAAALDHLVAWVKDGKAPPAAPPIDLASANPVAIARDADGNSSGGGIRLAGIAVPIAVNTGQNSGPGFCRLYGSHVDFDDARLASRYPTHSAYVNAVRAVTEKNLKAGYILKPEADATIAAAEHSAIGKAKSTPQILLLSNRADLISGGDALVEIKWPAGANASSAKVTLNGADITSSFAQRHNGRYMGVVAGLKNGDNVLTARAGGSGSSISIINHPIGGPVFSGAQLQPWVCATETAKTVTVTGNAGSTPPTAQVTTRVSGLGSDPLDDQCNATTVYAYYYRKANAPADCTFGVAGANACYTQYDPQAMPADAEIASFTNDRGAQVKDLIRVERGAINRGIYTIASLFDPRDANTPWAPPKGWNGKLLWEFGASASHSRFQTAPARQLFDSVGGLGLQRGFMVGASSLTDHGTNSNDVLGAETLMMVKELIAERYGEIRYTIGDGCSGGSIKQLAIASAYPGLLDGIQPQCTYADALTPFIEIPDCGGLQAHYYASNPHGQALTAEQRSAIDGHTNAGFCGVWITSFLPAMDPARAQNCGLPANSPLVFNRHDNPTGIRCTAVDHLASVLGTSTGADGITRAATVVDNVGVQYGLKALRDGVISAEEFVRVNEGVGGYDNDLVWHPERAKARPEALAIHYRSGLVSDGRQLARVPIIDMRGNQNPNGDIHANWRPYSVRDRLDRDAGGHANQVIWKFNSAGGAAAPGAALLRKAFTTLDAWLTAIEADHSANPIDVKVRNDRPAAAVDFCIATTGATEADLANTSGIEDPDCPVKQQSSPRQVAGGPRAENIYKCQLKPLVLTDPDYGGAQFSSDQQARLKAVFPDGVCNWNVPGVGQQPASPWTTFAAGPGGRPLGPPPVSKP